LLYAAWLAAPQLAEANWHTGRVKVGEEWLPLGEAINRRVGDADEAKYAELRTAATSAKTLRDLARWCRKHDMLDRARLHYAQLLTSTAVDGETQREAIGALELENFRGQWLTHEEVVSRRKQMAETQSALEKWLPVLQRLQPAIDGNDFRRRDEAIAEFHQLDEPTIVVALEAALPALGPRFQEEAVKRLATFREYEATLALVRYAILSSHGVTRRDATVELKKRPLHEYVPLLLGGLKAPLRSQFQVRWDARGHLAYDHAVLQERPTSNVLLLSHHVSVPYVATQRTETRNVKIVPRTEKTNLKVIETRFGRSKREAFLDERQTVIHRALNDQAAVQLANSQLEAENQRIDEVLQATTNSQQQRSPAEWWSWWQDYNQYSWPKPTYYAYQWNAQHYAAYQYVHRNTSGTQRIGGSCFLAGTPIRTETGPQPIESIRIGDRVLSQNPDTGELAYKIVLQATLRPPARMVRLTIGDDNIVTTLGHPFWVNGHGWKMAKELAPGDLIHGLGGAVKVDRIEPMAENKAHNLVVDDFNTYFVGVQGLLVHDNEFRRPTRAIVPGLVDAAD
jgi:hypothetical protein